MRLLLYSISMIVGSMIGIAAFSQSQNGAINVEADQYPQAMAEDVTPGWIERRANRTTVVFGENVDVFVENGDAFTPIESGETTLSYADGRYRYECCDGTVVVYEQNLVEGYAREDIVARATEVTTPDGITLLFSYHALSGVLPTTRTDEEPSTITLLMTFETTVPDGKDQH